MNGGGTARFDLRKSLYSPEHEVFGDVLRAARRAAGLSQAALAARLGRPQSFVSKCETGERRLDVIELRTLCLALGTDLATFVRTFEAALARSAPRRDGG